MRTLEKLEVVDISGGADLYGIPVGITTGIMGAAYRWYQGDGVFSGSAFIWGAVGAALGAGSYYGVKAGLGYLQKPAETE